MERRERKSVSRDSRLTLSSFSRISSAEERPPAEATGGRALVR